jgi:signal transduction histidine kinase
MSIGLAVAAVLQLAEPELLLDLFWVTILIGAFVFSLTGALVRIALASVFVIGYTFVEAGGLGPPAQFEVLDLAEWPLLIVILILVALLADRLATTARRYAGLYRRASDRLLSAQEVERGRLSRDLHDSVGQTLTAVLLSLDAAEADLAGATPPAAGARAAVQRAQVLAEAALEQARDVAAQLRPPRLNEVGMGAAITDLAGMAGVPVDARFDPLVLPPGLLEADQEIGIYRIVQEAMGNAARHSRAQHIWIDASRGQQAVTIEVGDDGVGFDPDSRPERGLGLAGMRERADSLGARLAVHSRPGSGTTVTLVVRRPVAIAPSKLGTVATEIAH